MTEHEKNSLQWIADTVGCYIDVKTHDGKPQRFVPENKTAVTVESIVQGVDSIRQRCA